MAAKADEGVNALSVGEGVLQHFWELAALDQTARETATVKLVQDVVTGEEAFQAASAAPQQSDEDCGPATPAQNGTVPTASSPLTVYVLRRLVRGLGSGRQGARQGFALAITALLARVKSVTVDAVLTLLESSLEVSNTMGGQDARDALLGRIFGCAAVVRSGRVTDAAVGVKLVQNLLAAAAKKSFMQEAAAGVVLELLESVGASLAGQVLLGCPELLEMLTLAPGDSTPEALLLAVRLWSIMPADVRQKCLLLPDGCAPPPAAFFHAASNAEASGAPEAAAAFFTPQHVRALLPVLRAASGAHPRLHSLWPSLLALLLPGFTADKVDAESKAAAGERSLGRAGPGQLEALWQTALEGDFFHSPSHERKYLGFQLFNILLPYLRPEQVPAVFSRQFLRSLVNTSASDAAMLHSAAKRCTDRLTAYVARSPDAQLQIAVAVALQRYGGLGFDRLSKTKTTAKLLQGLNAEGVQLYVAELRSSFLEAAAAPGAEAAIDKGRTWAVEQLCGAVQLPAASAAVKLEALHFLATHAFFAVQAKYKSKVRVGELAEAAKMLNPVSQPVRELCAARLLTISESMSKASRPKPSATLKQGIAVAEPEPEPQQKPSKRARKGDAAQSTPAASPAPAHPAAAEPVAQTDYLALAFAFIRAAQSASGCALAVELPEGAEAALSVLKESEASISSLLAEASKERRTKLAAWQALLRLLQLYTLGAPSSIDPELANDLAVITASAFEGAEAQPLGDGEEDDKDEATAWPDALVDAMLSLLSKTTAPLPSAPLRDAVETVFRNMCGDVTATGLQDMVRVVAEVPAGGAVDGVLGADSDAEAEEQGGSEEDEEEDESEKDDEEGAAAGAEQPRASGQAADTDAGSDEDEEAEEAMDDSAMFRMDSMIAAVLRQGAAAKPNTQENKEHLRNFKFRVIALLEFYLRKVPASPLLPAIVPPLLRALSRASRSPDDKTLAERLRSLLVNKLCKTKAEASGASLGGAELEALLKAVLYAGAREPNKQAALAADSAFIYLLRVASSRASGSEASPEAVTALRAAMEDFFDKRASRLPRKVLEDGLRAVPAAGAALLPLPLGRAASASTAYRRTEALAVLAALLRPAKGHTEAVAAALRTALPQLPAAALAAVQDPGKPQRFVEGLKGLLSCLQSGKQLLPDVELLDKATCSKLADTVNSARQMDPAPPPKVETQLARLVQMLNLKVAPKPAKIPVVAPTAAEKEEKAAKRKSGACDDGDAEAETKGKKIKAKGDRKDKAKGVKKDKVKKQKREQ